MGYFELPETTRVNRVVPKNAFEKNITAKDRRLFIDLVQRITWTHKLSFDTINLKGEDISEIQIFKFELKKRAAISRILEIVNRAIPYRIISWVEYNDEAYLSTTSKHAHPTNEDIAVLDWTFTSAWFPSLSNPYSLNLTGSLDEIYKDICIQLSGSHKLKSESLTTIVKNQEEVDRLKKQIEKLKASIRRAKQFNKKVELNLKLKEAEKALQSIFPG